MTEFIHNGVKITLDESAKFRAMVAGRMVTKSSLSAMQKAIDAASKFQEFDALVLKWSTIKPVRVTGKIKSRSRYSGHIHEWVTSSGNHGFVYPKSAEKALREWIKLESDTDKQIERLRDAVAKAQNAIERLEAK